jgi:hypothetical protein
MSINMKKKVFFFFVMFHNSTNINKVNNHLSNEIIEHKKDDDVNKIERYDITEILLNTITLTHFQQLKFSNYREFKYMDT